MSGAGSDIRRRSTARLPTRFGRFAIHAYSGPDGSPEHVALVLGVVDDGAVVTVRLHSECLTGEVFGSLRCDCGAQLTHALQAISDAGRGVLVYLRGHEGRGIGLVRKLQAYALQDGGLDTVQANLELGLPADARDYAAGAAILHDLGVRSVRLLTNNPEKIDALVRHGVVVVERLRSETTPNDENRGYLRAKEARLGHLLGTDQRPSALSAGHRRAGIRRA